jgi:hypothetical protein
MTPWIREEASGKALMIPSYYPASPGGVLCCWCETAVGGLPNFLAWSLFVPQVTGKAIYRSPLRSRFIEESSIQPPTTLIINALQEVRAHHNNFLFSKRWLAQNGTLALFARTMQKALMARLFKAATASPRDSKGLTAHQRKLIASLHEGPTTKEGAAVAAQHGEDPRAAVPVPRKPRYRCRRACVLGKLDRLPGEVWDLEIERGKLLPYLEGNPTPVQIDDLVRRISPEPTPGADWKIIVEGGQGQ